MTQENYKRLQMTYGEQFLRYVLAVPDNKAFPDDITQPAEQVANLLAALSLQLPIDDDGGSMGASMALSSHFSQFVPEQQTTLANNLRAMSGGIIEDAPSTSDHVLELLSQVARDLWPVYLLPPPNQGPKLFWMSSPIGLYHHPLLNELLAAFLDDKKLRKLFPGAEPIKPGNDWTTTFNIQALWIMNSGGGGSQQLTTVVGNLFLDTVIRASMENGKLDHNGMMTHLSESLNTLRQLADGKITNVPAILGFSGVQLEEGTEITLPTGVLRQIRAIERDLILNSSSTVSVVFETTFPLQILEIGQHDLADDNWHKKFQKYGSRMEEAQRTFQHGLDQVRLSILLSSNDDEYLGSNEVCRFVANPSQPGGSSAWTMDTRTPLSFVLPVNRSQDVVDWHKLINVKHPESLNIAMKRLLSAASSRFDSNDAFIDALIVWENAFGTRTETTFRVTGALAKLIEPDDFAKRHKLQKELSTLYGVRSSLVHGGKEPDASKSWEYRQRSIAVAIDCLRRLYKDRPDLLAISSEDRSKTLLLEQ